MYSHGIDILHVTDCDRRIIRIPYDFIFDLLVSFDTLLDKYLMDR